MSVEDLIRLTKVGAFFSIGSLELAEVNEMDDNLMKITEELARVLDNFNEYVNKKILEVE